MNEQTLKFYEEYLKKIQKKTFAILSMARGRDWTICLSSLKRFPNKGFGPFWQINGHILNEILIFLLQNFRFDGENLCDEV